MDDQLDARHYLEERYRGDETRRGGLMRGYYALKPMLPRRLQIALRRALREAPGAHRVSRWPIEPLLVERASELRGLASDRTGAASRLARRQALRGDPHP